MPQQQNPHGLTTISPKLHIRLVQLTEAGADYSEVLQCLRKEGYNVNDRMQQVVWEQMRDWGLV